MSEVKVKFEQEKETKGTWRFKEAGIGPVDTPMIGTLYVPKATLKQIGWEPGKALVITLDVK